MATKLGDLYVDIRADVSKLQKDMNKATKVLEKTNKTTQRMSKSQDSYRKNLVRTVRQLETLYVMYKSIATITEQVIVKGLELNSMYENQALGISALTSAKVEMYDASGKELNAYDKFLASQQMTISLMDDIREASLKTPASFSQMLGFYNQTIGHAITSNNTFGKSMEDVNKNVITFTQRMSSLGMATGMEMTKLNEEIRSLMSGNASIDSLLAVLLFGSPAEANVAVKKAKKSTEGLSTLLLNALAPFENVEGVMTYSKAVSQLGAQFDDLRRFGTESMFADLTNIAQDVTKYLKENMKSISSYIDNIYNNYRAFVITIDSQWLGIFDAVKSTMNLISDMLSDLSSISDFTAGIGENFFAWKGVLLIIKGVLNTIQFFVLGINNALLGVKYATLASAELLGISKGLSEEEQNHLDNAKRKIKVYAEGTKQYETHLKTIQTLEAKSKGDYSSELLKISEQITKNKAEQVQLAKEALSVEGRQNFLNGYESKKKELKLLADIRKAKDKASAISATELAVKNAGNNVEMLEKIGNTYSDNIKKIEALARVEEIRAKMAKESGSTSSKAVKAHNKALKDNLALQLKLAELEKARLELKDAKLGKLITEQELRKREIVLAKEALAKAKKTAKEIGAGTGADKARKKVIESEIKLVHSQTEMWEKINKDLLDTAKSFKSIMESSFDSMLSGDFGGAFNNMFDGLITELVKPMKDSISTMFGNLFSKDGMFGDLFGGFTGGLIGIGLSLVGGLFSNTLSQEELDNAKGITEVESDSIENILSMLNFNSVRELKYSKGIYENMRALVEASDKASVQLGNDFNPTGSTSSSFLGFSTKNVTYLASGLEITATSVDDLRKELLNARQYETTRTQSSSFWGLFSSDKLETVYSDLDDEVIKSITNGYVAGLEAIRDAGTVLGVQTIDTLLDGFTTGTHDLNFKDKSQEEISAMISGAMSADFDAFIAETMPFIEQYQKVGEDLLETLVRVAYEFESVQNALDKLGGSLSAFGENAIDVSEAMIDASGGLDNFLSNVSGYIENFYTDVEKQQLRYDTIMSTTGILPANMDEYKALVNSYVDLASSGSVSSAEKLAELLDMQQTYYDYYDYIIQEEKRLAEEKQKLLEEELAQAQSNYDFYKSIYDKIVNAYTGSLSYLNSVEQANYLDRMAQNQFDSGDTQGYIDTLYAQLEAEKKISLTREDYADKFETYIDELKAQEPEATTDDVVESLDQIYEKLDDLATAIEKASYQN